MALPTAPCTRCRNTVVYGERQCRQCGEPFNYGPAAPPEPTPAQIMEALSAASGGDAPVSSPTGIRAPARAAAAPAALSTTPVDPMIDTGRAQKVGAVATEAVPGLIDSRLFGAMVPENIQVETMPGIERTVADDVPLMANDASMAGFLDTGRFDEATEAPAVPTEAVPGLIDSRLFGAMVPDNIAIPTMDDVERQANSGTRGGPAGAGEVGDATGTVVCADCGAKRLAQHNNCPDCGSSRTR
jgi:hypothetical protein